MFPVSPASPVLTKNFDPFIQSKTIVPGTSRLPTCHLAKRMRDPSLRPRFRGWLAINLSVLKRAMLFVLLPVFFASCPGLLVHRQVEFAISRLTQGECILHGDFAASCGEGLSHFPKVGMEGSGPSKEFAPHSDFRASRRSGCTSVETYPS